MNLTSEQIRDTLSAIDDEIATLESEFDEALIGYAEGWFPYNGGPSREGVARGVVAVYDVNKCIHVIMKDGTSAGDASEFFSCNLLAAHRGDKSPVFVTFLREKTDGPED